MPQQRWSVRGIVQGVGFRPFVYRLAQELALSGWVRNDGDGVTLEIAGDDVQLLQFGRRLQQEAPPLARIDSLTPSAPRTELTPGAFTIVDSLASSGQASIGADTAVCPACLNELFDPSNRRYRYALINCTDCGPRYSLVSRLPYDRANTSMAPFEQCAPCWAEYRNPLQRRFHAEPNACPDCGPRLQLLAANGREIDGDAIATTLALLQAGQIVAIKGLGGFHLVCDARNPAAVAELRRRKQREAKPLAVMAANLASLSGWAQLSTEAQRWLRSVERPIVLLDKTAHTDEILPCIAPGLSEIGVLLPYTPIHYLLFHEAAARPAGVAWLDQPQSLLLVMTSANAKGEPLVTDNAQALAQLAGIADAFLLHQREIVIRCDDSVLRAGYDDEAQFIRRARGYTPVGIALTPSKPTVMAFGGFFKNTICLTRGAQAFLSQYIGDLDRVANCRALEQASQHLLHLLAVQPSVLAHDRHPDFYSSQLAQRYAAQWQIPCLAVQHHHAHIAAVLAEHQLDEPVLGLALDGVGLGDDGTAWGGELLLVDGAQVQRLAHLRSLAMPGGDKAAREPWRMAASVLADLGRGDEIATRFAAQPAAAHLAQILARSPSRTSSMGRYFDAAAGLLGLVPVMSFEAQAAMQLEGLAAQYRVGLSHVALYQWLASDAAWQLDLQPLWQHLADETDPQRGAALFHAVLAQAWAEGVAYWAAQLGVRTVVGGGGCFLNTVLLRALREQLARRGLRLWLNHRVPCGDGGLALGQAWVAQRAGVN